MDNQKDQFGTTPNQPNASRSTNATAPATPAANNGNNAPRKAPAAPTADNAAGPSARTTDATSSAKTETTANAGQSRQGEGEQANGQEGNLLDTALTSGKKWIEDSGVLDSVNQLPQALKDLSNRAVERVSNLSTTQKIVGGAILAAGIGWLATRKGKSSSADESSDSSSYNYGRQRDAGSYGRRSYGYQSPDASTSRTDSGAPYAKGGSRFGSSGNYSTEASAAGNAGIKAGSGRDDSGSAYGASARTDHGSQPSSHASQSDYRSIE